MAGSGADQPGAGGAARGAAGVTVWPGSESPPFAALPGESAGNYKLLEMIGEGGFGAVYLAEQSEPVQRRVAVKILKPGMDSKAVLARFGAEMQALALMDHPGIAKVFDAGTTGRGRPFFVMEYVRGVPITEHCDRQRLTVRQRLELFVAVCDAVAHAHTKGIIHRDLKPGNILVALDHGSGGSLVGLPKIIDFGVAKAVQQRLTEHTVFTERGVFIGTLEYMSPEQAELTRQDIDTRSDVYSLGVVLYELLTGSLPFDPETLRSGGIDEIRRIIRDQEPPRPSTRLLSAERPTSVPRRSDATAVAHQRRAPLSSLVRELRSELEWIPLKAMRKERAQRYRSALEMADDVRNYLADRPLTAGPESVAYRARKFARRNRGAVIGGAAVLGALVAGLAGTLWQAGLAHREAAIARGAESEQRRLAAAEILARQGAEAKRALAERTSGFMAEIFGGVRPAFSRGADTAIIRGLMDDAAARIERGELADAPESELELRLTVGAVYRDLAEYGAAERMLGPALEQAEVASRGGDTQILARALDEWARLLLTRGRNAEAEPLFARCLEMVQRLHEGDHPEVAKALNNLGFLRLQLSRFAEAESLLREALEMKLRLFPGDHGDTSQALSNLAAVLMNLGRGAEAVPLLERALEMNGRLYPGDHPEVGRALNDLAQATQDQGDPQAAVPLYQRSLEMSRRLHKGDHPDIAAPLNNLAHAYLVLGRAAEAEPLFRETLEMVRRLSPGDHPDTLVALSNLATTRMSLGSPGEAEPVLEEAVAMSRRLFAGDHSNVAMALHNLGAARRLLKRPAEAEPLFRESLEMRRRLFAGDHPETINSLSTLGSLSMELSRPGEAEAFLREALAMGMRLWPDGHPRLVRYHENLASVLRSEGKTDEARRVAGEGVALGQKLLPPEHPQRRSIEAMGAALGALP